MAQQNRDKAFWLIPKRANLHQSVVLLKGILDLDYNRKIWNTSKQDRLGSYLGRSGATNSGRTITPQSLRTLLASIPQYFGFVFINTETTPSTLTVTKAGHALIEELTTFLEEYDYDNLREAEKDNGVISYSDIYLNQFLKLQLTNPVILKDCEDILVFPLIFTLQVLKKTRYITYEEIAFFIFKSKSQDEVEVKILEILNFRNLNYDAQLKLIEAFKNTHLGNISLVQAPSVNYFQNLCSYTDLIKKSSVYITEGEKKRKVLTIEINKQKEYLINTLLEKHNFKPYDFKNNLNLWLQYIGDTNVMNTPKDVTIINKTKTEQLILVKDTESIISGNLISPNSSLSFPAIEKREYKIVVYDKDTGLPLSSYDYNFFDDSLIEIKDINTENINVLEKTQVEKEIIAHISSNNFSKKYSNYLSIIETFNNKNLLDSKNLRGARLEYLFYQYFLKLEKDGVIDEVIWNGRIGQYGIPTPSPGGTFGDPDIILFVENILIVVELTTIKSKSMQWSAEGASVPDHIKIVEKKYCNNQIFALYLAPIIHKRVTNSMLSNLNNYESKLICIEIDNFLEIARNFKNKTNFINFLHNKHKI